MDTPKTYFAKLLASPLSKGHYKCKKILRISCQGIEFLSTSVEANLDRNQPDQRAREKKRNSASWVSIFLLAPEQIT